MEEIPSAKSVRGHVIACSHGAGPLVLLDAEHQRPLKTVFNQAAQLLNNTKGIVLITAHWETEHPHISAAASHDLLYDYPKTLPREAFEFTYPASGDPGLAKKVANKLEVAGFEPKLEHERGWDHGLFVPMIYLRPQADIPIVQMSILKSQDAAAHLRMGQALAPLLDEGYSIIGSGSSWHNFKDFLSAVNRQEPVSKNNRAFEAALEDAMTTSDSGTRLRKLENWRSWPESDYIHPPSHADHFMPFLVTAGAGAQRPTYKGLSWHSLGVDFSTYTW